MEPAAAMKATRARVRRSTTRSVRAMNEGMTAKGFTIDMTAAKERRTTRYSGTLQLYRAVVLEIPEEAFRWSAGDVRERFAVGADLLLVALDGVARFVVDDDVGVTFANPAIDAPLDGLAVEEEADRNLAAEGLGGLNAAEDF